MKKIPTFVGTEANAHHTIWGSSDINPCGEDLLAYCVSADLNFYNVNVGNKPTITTKTREEVEIRLDCKMQLPKHKKTTTAINISLQSAQQRQYVF